MGHEIRKTAVIQAHQPTRLLEVATLDPLHAARARHLEGGFKASPPIHKERR